MTALTTPSPRPVLALLDGGGNAATAWSWFCGRCGASPSPQGELPSARRVCARCSFGVLLRARSDEVPAPHAPYLVVDASLTVQALSKAAELYLGITEELAVNRHVTELLIPADRSAGGSANLAVALSMAARGVGPASQSMVCRSNTFGERIKARITACGPPEAALVVLA
ncbi:MAG: PAS domain-containing protein [Actinomycetota bacterium]|nr:PAS domain-containing protein [Actinomycetota bacterium]